MNTSNLTKKSKLARSAAIGAVVSLALAAVGHRLDAAVPAIALDQQLLYNWASVLLAPLSFLMRLNDPDGAIVPSLSFVLVATALNAVWYAFLSWSFTAMRNTLRLPANSPARVSLLVRHAAVFTSASASRRSSPSEQLAARYEHRLSSESTDSAEVETSVLSGDRR